MRKTNLAEILTLAPPPRPPAAGLDRYLRFAAARSFVDALAAKSLARAVVRIEISVDADERFDPSFPAREAFAAVWPVEAGPAPRIDVLWTGELPEASRPDRLWLSAWDSRSRLLLRSVMACAGGEAQPVWRRALASPADLGWSP